ncbi:MAG: hypothetical protein JETT_1516 [Candidatus Jettenia ecosi]|uniref:Uncharacterized protein n=1 Tax=Candidatus Jettenia ecosi TaxID=2494326 RepID=A0A533QBZ8_9BACT|nr:MAG: hypothetical protein JETT_1516 [Candidatus Jettenia ecosi]
MENRNGRKYGGMQEKHPGDDTPYASSYFLVKGGADKLCLSVWYIPYPRVYSNNMDKRFPFKTYGDMVCPCRPV